MKTKNNKTRGADDVIYGRRAVAMFLEKSPRKARAVFLDRKLDGGVLSRFEALARSRGIEARKVERVAIDRLCFGGVHQGTALLAPPLGGRSLEKLKSVASSSPAARYLLLDGVTDPQNFGAICRSVEAFGLKGLILEERNSPPFDGASYKASAGAIEHVALYTVPSLDIAAQMLQGCGVKLYGLDASARDRLLPADIGQGQVALVLGSEGSGMRPSIRKRCDRMVSIPMLGKVESLNVSASAAIACYLLAST